MSLIRSINDDTSKLPKAIPRMNTASINENEKVEEPSTFDKIRIQATS